MRSMRWTGIAAVLLAGGLSMAGLAEGSGLAQVPDEGETVVIHLPMSFRGMSREALPAAPTLRATLPPSPIPETPTPVLTDTPAPSPTFTSPPVPTTPAETGTIFGRMTWNGAPLDIGFGSPGTPQIELRRQTGGEGPWELVANAEIIDENGGFVFENPPALAGGQVYQVWWDNPPNLGADIWMGRWWSRDVTAFGQGERIDLGSFEVADLKMTDPCHDCGQSPPIEFKWIARENASESYRWAVFKNCDQDVNERATAWLSPPLGRKTSYETGPPGGFRLGDRYCWYVRVEDGENGGGWPFYDRRVTWLASQAAARRTAFE